MEQLDRMVADEERDDNGLLADRVQLYGMEDFPLSKLEVLEGDLSALADPTANAVAAVYMSDDYGDAQEGSNWAKVGDKVRLRYVEELEYFYSDTGEIIPPEQVDAAYDSGRGISSRAKTYRDAEYTVVAAVLVPHSLDYRYYGADEFVMGAEQFKRDTQTSSVMTYVFDVADGTDGSMEAFLKDYTENVQPLFDYESKATYQAEFDSFRTMFLTLGLALSLIIGLVGVLKLLKRGVDRHHHPPARVRRLAGYRYDRKAAQTHAHARGAVLRPARARTESCAQRDARAAGGRRLLDRVLVLHL